MIQKYLKIFLSCLAFFLLSQTLYAANHLDKIAIVVNDQVITESELTQIINAMSAQQKPDGEPSPASEIRKAAIDQLIARDLQLQIAKANNITVGDENLNNALQQVASEHQISLAQLPEALAQQGLTFDQFKSQLKDQLLIEKFQQQQLGGSIIITPKEIDAEVKKLKQHPDNAKQTLYHFEDLLIPLPANPTAQDISEAKQKFNAVAQAINQNKDFETIGQTILNAPPQDLGWRSKDKLPEAFIAIAQKLKPGQVAPPARAPNGIHILKLIETKVLTSPGDLNSAITETHVRHILLIKDSLTPDATLERRLLSLRDDLTHGKDFAKLAESNSQDPGSVANGGDLGWVKPQTMDPKFEAAMNKLAVNDISQPIKTQFGWHLIQVLGRRQIDDPETALKVKAQQILFQQKLDEAIKQMISQLKSQAYIKIYEQ